MALKYDKDLSSALQAVGADAGFQINNLLNGSPESMQIIQKLMANNQSPSDIQVKIYETQADDGHAIKIYRFSPNVAPSSPGPAILHMHGGGMVAGSVPEFAASIAAKVAASGVTMYSVEYRLATQKCHPTPVDDCYTSLLWLYKNAKQLNIDQERIAVMGESSGGGLAASVALLARDKALSPPLAKQILIYPMIDDRNIVPDEALEPFVTWMTPQNIFGWQTLLDGKAGTDGVSQYAAPARAESLEGLPSTYIDVGGLDIFRDEDIKYATRLIAAGVETELHVYPGVPHGFEIFAAGAAVVGRAQMNRMQAIKSF